MTPANMRYKGYVWSHNPKTLKITTMQNLSEQSVMQGRARIQDFGLKSRVITGSGNLYGEDCLEQYGELIKLHNQGGSGILSLPDTPPFYAYFKSVELACDPTPKLITYNFEFVEDLWGKKENPGSFYHTVGDGETLWDISYMYSVPVETLVDLNPQIMRLDELPVESRVKIC